MVDDPRRRALLGIGLLLVTTPVWAPALDVTGRDYEYRTATVTVENDRIRVHGDHPRLGGFEGVDCIRELIPSRRCAFESRLLDGSSLRAPYPGVRHGAGAVVLDAAEQYVAFPGDGRVYERTTAWNESAGAYVLELERANASHVLGRVGRPVEGHRPPVREAVESGAARADEPLPEPELVAADGRYHLVYTARTTTLLVEKPFTERVFELVAVVAGVFAFRLAWVGDDPERW